MKIAGKLVETALKLQIAASQNPAGFELDEKGERRIPKCIFFPQSRPFNTALHKFSHLFLLYLFSSGGGGLHLLGGKRPQCRHLIHFVLAEGKLLSGNNTQSSAVDTVYMHCIFFFLQSLCTEDTLPPRSPVLNTFKTLAGCVLD